jgi:hypothetical protein
MPAGYTLSAATNAALGGMKLNQAAADATINTASTTAGKNYPINLTTEGVGYVNVPWTDTTYTLPVATNAALGGVKLGAAKSATLTTTPTATAETGRYCPVQTDNNDAMVVNIPTQTTVSGNAGTATKLAAGQTTS